jgi:hypothetical protein
MSYRPFEPLVPKQQNNLYVSAVYCDKNPEQRIDIKFCVEIDNASETALLTVACGVCDKKKSSVLNGTGGLKKGDKRCRMTQEVGRV